MKTRILLGLFVLMLAGCEKPQNFANYDPHAAFPTTATKKTAHLDLAPLVQGHAVAADNTRIDDFIDAYHRQGEAPIAITITAPSLSDIEGRKMASDTAVLLQKRGVAARDIKLFINESPLRVGPQLAFPIYVVTGRDCGHWQNPVDHDPQAQNTDNFGCSMQQNIDVMAANPRDLLMPSPSTGRDGVRSWTIVENYQMGKAIPGSDDIRAGVITSIGTQAQ
ncbi:MAG TPA: CpaD family pilus assembly lipoprotein [Terriglobia bacterium]|nr:CpaD family pilus assembly lipoprotein [Terriglobia bacterium]